MVIALAEIRLRFFNWLELLICFCLILSTRNLKFEADRK